MFPCDLSSGSPSSDNRSWALIRSRTPDMGWGVAILLPRPSPALSHLTGPQAQHLTSTLTQQDAWMDGYRTRHAESHCGV